MVKVGKRRDSIAARQEGVEEGGGVGPYFRTPRQAPLGPIFDLQSSFDRPDMSRVFCETIRHTHGPFPLPRHRTWRRNMPSRRVCVRCASTSATPLQRAKLQGTQDPLD